MAVLETLKKQDGHVRTYQCLTTDSIGDYPTDCSRGSTMLVINATTKTVVSKHYYSGTEWLVENNAVNTERVLTGRAVLVDTALAFANDAAANTVKNIDITKPAVARDRHTISVYNPSTVTDLTVRIFTKQTMTAGTRYVYVGEFAVAKAATVKGVAVDAYSKIVEGLFVGGDARIVVTNDTILGAATGFTGSIKIDEF